MAVDTPPVPGVGASVDYYANKSSVPMPAMIAQDLGNKKYNLRVVGIDANATGKLGVTFLTAADPMPTSGEFCCMPGGYAGAPPVK